MGLGTQSFFVSGCAGLGLLFACGSAGNNGYTGDGGVSSSSSSGGVGLVFPDASPAQDAGSVGPPPMAISNPPVNASDCAGCTFPPLNAPSCSGAPAIQIVYPPDTVLLPPNLAVLSVMWTPHGSAFQRFEVDFSNPPNTDWRIITACQNQTQDTQGAPSGGCEIALPPASWSALAAANRGGGPVTVTVRGTTDGNCASSSSSVTMSFAEQDLLGTYYYWKSTISSNGVGGQIWAKIFGDLNTPEKDVTTASINATCNGCHALSRDGSRMVVYSDDDDSDDEYSDVAGSLLDMTTMPNATEFPRGVTSGGHGGGGQPPGFSTINPNAEYYITSNGYPCTGAGGACPSGIGAAGYPGPVPSNGFSLWSAANGTFARGVTVGAANTRPTMPDWSIDGKTVVYVQPAGEYTSWRKDDTHIYGGSLYTVPYNGGGAFGTPTVFLQSSGENNYYPSFSPEMSYVLFNRAPLAMGGSANACSGGFCPNDSFANPAARLMLIRAGSSGAAPVDLEKANGSAASSPTPLSNSYPRWTPFVQNYKGDKLLWFTFSSTRDYGLRVLNHKAGMYQCYPADAAETPGASHHQAFDVNCQEPQLWMAALNLSEAQGNIDPSRVAFWIPYQDMTTHNHTAQWTAQSVTKTPPDGGVCVCTATNQSGCAGSGCGCCDKTAVCDATGTCRVTLQ